MNLQGSEKITESKGYAFLAMGIPLVIGLIMAAGTFLFVNRLEEKNIQNQFTHIADLHVASFEREIKVNLEVLRGVWDFLTAEPAANRHQFKIFTQDSLQRLSSILALEWVPRVPDQYRSYYEASAQSDGLDNFQFTERTQKGVMVQAETRPEYYPVYYAESLEPNRDALGFDLASNPIRLDAIEQSRDSGNILTTSPLTLVQGEGEIKRGFLVLLPLYDGTARTIEQRRKLIKGFALGVYKIENIFAAALEKSQLIEAEIAIQLIDNTEKSHPELLYIHQEKYWKLKADVQDYYHDLSVAGRDWQLQARPTSDFIANRKGTEPYLFASLVMFITLALTFYIGLINNRSRAVKKLVKLRTQELVASESKIRAILETAVNAIITIDGYGNIDQFNPQAEILFGYSPEEVKGKNVKMLMPDPYHSNHDQFLDNYRKTREPRIIGIGREVEALSKDGSIFPIYLSVGETRIENESMFVGVITDISQQKEIQKELIKAKEEAETSNRMKSEFVNMMSHELRTPLTVILGYIPVLKKAGKLPVPELVEQIAEDIQHSGDHLVNIISDLLDISKIEAGKLELNSEQLVLKEVIDNAISSIDWKAKKKGIELNVIADEGEFIADQVRMQQVLINLIGNAIKFTEKGEITVTGRDLGNIVEISVQDTGCGIPEKDQQYIFNKFHQVDGSSTRSVGGSGLGLAITKYLVELHDGSIDVESRPGVGSTFTFTIPIDQEKN